MEINFENLKADLLYIKSIKDQIKDRFYMRYYRSTCAGQKLFMPIPMAASKGKPDLSENCGTYGCLLGFMLTNPEYNYDCTNDHLFDYGIECADRYGIYQGTIEAHWEFLFDSRWFIYFPTVDDAIERLEYFILNKSVPDGFVIDDISLNFKEATWRN